MELTISKSFNTRVEKSARVLEVAEAFGLGLTDKQFVVYDDLKIEINPKDVCYVAGQSGSGKSLLLRDLSDQLRAAGLRVYDLADVPLLDLPLVDQIGTSTEEALKLLSQAGLNDAYLFIRKPSELSDGQKYRFKLAKLIESNADVWIADEFCAVLDRETAKVVAHNVARVARTAGVILLVATTHDDLREYLGASLTVEKLYGTRVEVKRLGWQLDGEYIVIAPEPPKPEKPVKEAKAPKAPKVPKIKPPKPVAFYHMSSTDPNTIIRTWRMDMESPVLGPEEYGTMVKGVFKLNRKPKDGTKPARKPKSVASDAITTTEHEVPATG